MRRRALLWLLLVVLVPVLSGCFVGRIDVDVREDGAAHLVVAVDTPSLLGGFVDQAFAELPPDVEAEDFVDGDFRGVQVDTDVDDLPDLSDVVVTEDPGGGWRFRMEVPAAPPIGGAPSLEVSVLLPGRQVEDNADRLGPDGAFLWAVPLGDEPQVLFARTEPGEPILGEDGTSAVPWAWVVGSIVAILALVAAGAVVARRSGPLELRD